MNFDDEHDLDLTLEDDQVDLSISSKEPFIDEGYRGELSDLDDSTSDYFLTPSLQGLIQQLVYLAEFCEGVAVVEAQVGAGKSALFHSLQTQISCSISLASVEVKSDADFSLILQDIVASFGLGKSTQESDLLSELDAYNASLLNEQKSAVVLIDDAHLLDDQALEGLLGLLSKSGISGAGLHLVFFASKGFVDRIDAFDLLELPVYDFELPAFSRDELAGFFSTVTGDNLPPEQVSAIWVSSHGMPGKALSLLTDIQAEKKASLSLTEKSEQLFRSMPLAHVSALGFLLIALIWAMIGREGEELEESLPLSAGQQAAKAPELKPFLPKLQMDKSLPNEPNSSDDKTEVNSAGTVLGSTRLGFDTDEKPPIKTVIPSVSDAQQVADLKPKSEPVEIAEIQSTDESKTLSESEKAKEMELQGQNEVGAGIDSANANLSANTVDLSNDAKPKASSERIVSLSEQDEEFLLAAPASYYTLQVLAASKGESLRAYINKQENAKDLYLYRGLRQGKQWYVVVSGLFPSRKQAIEGIKALPPTQRKAGPWPRKLESLQIEIEANRANF